MNQFSLEDKSTHVFSHLYTGGQGLKTRIERLKAMCYILGERLAV